MSHNSNYTQIYTTANEGLSIEEIKDCLGATTRDLGSLCVHTSIKPFAKFKPEYSNLMWLTNDDRANNRYSLFIRDGITGNYYYELAAGINVSGNSSTWKNMKMWYRRPIGGIGTAPYRQLDFASYKNNPPTPQAMGYYTYAPAFVFHTTCKGGDTLSANILDNTSSSYICFYGNFRNLGSFYTHKAFSTSDGINVNASLVPSGESSTVFDHLSLSLENLLRPTLSEQYPTTTTIEGGYFGVYILKQNGDKVGFYPCEKPFDDYDQVYNEMFKLPLIGSHGLIDPDRQAPDPGPVEQGSAPSVGESSDSNSSSVQDVPSGTYTAVPLILYDSKYYPAFVYNTSAAEIAANSGYGANFTVVLGGQEMYRYDYVAVKEGSNPYDTSASIITTAESVSIKMKIWNYSYPKTTGTQVSQNGRKKFWLYSYITAGKAIYGIDAQEHSLAGQDDHKQIATPTGAFTIPYNSTELSNYTELTFNFAWSWYSDPSQSGQLIDKGYIDIRFRLLYDDVVIGNVNWAAKGLRIYYNQASVNTWPL